MILCPHSLLTETKVFLKPEIEKFLSKRSAGEALGCKINEATLVSSEWNSSVFPGICRFMVVAVQCRGLECLLPMRYGFQVQIVRPISTSVRPIGKDAEPIPPPSSSSNLNISSITSHLTPSYNSTLTSVVAGRLWQMKIPFGLSPSGPYTCPFKIVLSQVPQIALLHPNFGFNPTFSASCRIVKSSAAVHVAVT